MPMSSPNQFWWEMLYALRAGRDSARAALQIEIEYHVGNARLPAGLVGDGSTRRDIAARVQRLLEANHCAWLHEWVQRDRNQHDHSSWRRFIRTLVTREALGYARDRGLAIETREPR